MSNIKSLSLRIEKVQKTFRNRALTRTVFIGLIFFSTFILLAEAVNKISSIQESTAFIFAATTLATTAAFTVQQLFAKVFRLMPKGAIAKAVEKKNPELQDALICAVEKEDIEENSRGIIEKALISKVTKETANLDFLKAACPSTYKLNILVIFAVIAVTLFSFAVMCEVADKAQFKLLEHCELIDPGLKIQPGDIYAAKQSDLTIEAKINRWQKEAKIILADSTGEHEFVMNQRSGNFDFTLYDVHDEIKYKILTPSLASSWHTVSTYIPPKIESLIYQIIPPVYVKQGTMTITELKDTAALQGSSVKFTLTTDSEDTQAFLILNDKEIRMQNTGIAAREISFKLEKTSTLQIKLKSKDDRIFETNTVQLEALPDLAPIVTIIQPDTDTSVRPDSAIQFKARAGDDFGISSITIHFSISGRTDMQQLIYQTTSETEIKTEMDAHIYFETAPLNLENGDVISFYFTANDNCQPLQQSGRSEIGFIEIRPEMKPKKANNEGEKKKIDVSPLIAETKRLIRMSYEIMSAHHTVKEKLLEELRPALADLNVESVKIADEVKAATSGGIVELFDEAIDSIKNAELKVRSNDTRSSVSDMQVALAKFTKIAQMLMQNTISDKESKKGEGSQSEAKKQEQQKQDKMDLNTLLKKLADLNNEINHLADRQGALNSTLQQGLTNQFSSSERQQSSRKQKSIHDKTASLKDKLPLGFDKLHDEMDIAKYSMKGAISSLIRNKPTQAFRSGREAHSSLLRISKKLKDVKKKIISDQIQKMSDKASKLAAEQQKQAVNSNNMAGKKVEKEEHESAQSQQNKLAESSKDLMRQAERLASMLEENYPKASKEMIAAVTKAQKSRIETMLKRAKNALFYKKYKHAENYQKKIAGILKQLSSDFSQAKTTLPKMSQEEMVAAMQEMQRAKEQLKALKGKADKESADKAAEINGKMGQLMKKLYKDLKEAKFNELNLTMEIIKGAPTLEMGIEGAYQVLTDAQNTLNQYLIKNAFKNELKLKRKTISTPDKFRNQVEEYFKSLSE